MISPQAYPKIVVKYYLMFKMLNNNNMWDPKYHWKIKKINIIKTLTTFIKDRVSEQWFNFIKKNFMVFIQKEW